MILSSLANYKFSEIYEEDSVLLNDVTEKSYSTKMTELGIEGLEIITNISFDNVIKHPNGSYIGISSTDKTFTYAGITVQPPSSSTTTYAQCLISSFNESKVHWSMMYSATGSNLGDIKCQNIVFYEYGIRVIGIVEHTDNSYSSTAIQTKLYWGNTTIKSSRYTTRLLSKLQAGSVLGVWTSLCHRARVSLQVLRFNYDEFSSKYSTHSPPESAVR